MDVMASQSSTYEVSVAMDIWGLIMIVAAIRKSPHDGGKRFRGKTDAIIEGSVILAESKEGPRETDRDGNGLHACPQAGAYIIAALPLGARAL